MAECREIMLYGNIKRNVCIGFAFVAIKSTGFGWFVFLLLMIHKER